MRQLNDYDYRAIKEVLPYLRCDDEEERNAARDCILEVLQDKQEGRTIELLAPLPEHECEVPPTCAFTLKAAELHDTAGCDNFANEACVAVHRWVTEHPNATSVNLLELMQDTNTYAPIGSVEGLMTCAIANGDIVAHYVAVDYDGNQLPGRWASPDDVPDTLQSLWLNTIPKEACTVVPAFDVHEPQAWSE